MRRAVLAAVVVFGFGSHAFAQAAPDPVATRCTPPELTGKMIRYEVDLATATAGTKVHYKTSDEVQVVFRNKNPFLFDYRIKIEEQALPEPDLAAFFKLLNASDTIPVLGALPKLIPNVPALPEAAPRGQNACRTAGNAARRALKQEQDAVVLRFDNVKQQAETSTTLLTALQKDVTAKEEKLKDAGAGCESLVKNAIEANKAIDAGLDESKPGFGQSLKSFKDQLEAYKKGVSDFEIMIAAQRIVMEQQGCPDDSIKETLRLPKAELELFKESLDPKNEAGAQKVAADLTASAKALAAKNEDIATVLKDPRNFLEVRTIGDYDDPTLVTITVDRKKREEKDFPSSPFLTRKLRFGGRQRFALAVGAAFSGIDTATFKAIQGIPLQENGMPDGTDAARIVGLDEESNQRVSPLIMLHTRLCEKRSWISGIHFSLGFAGATGNNGVNLEYLVGPSLSFAEERFFLTFGVYNGRTQRLQDGFWVGRKLPDTVPDVPVVRGRSWDWGVAATYKFR